MNNCFYAIVIAVLLPIADSGYANTPPLAKPGDQVQVDFTCRLGDGGLVETTLAKVAGNDNAKRSPIFVLRDSYRPLYFVIPETKSFLQSQPFDPLEQKIVHAIANKITEFPLGQTTSLELHSTPIENFPSIDRYVEMAMKFTLPRTQVLPIQEFESRYGLATNFAIGAVINDKSPFPGVIRDKDGEKITIFLSVREGATIPTVAGEAVVRELNDEKFQASMDVHEGQLIKQIGGLPGRVTAVDDKNFVIDFGQSYAGETLYCEALAQLDDPGKTQKQSTISWVEDYNIGLTLAGKQQKPAVLFLYGEGCTDCHEMTDKIFLDPSLQSVRDSFVWLKINAEKFPEVASKFGQKGPSLTLVLSADGSELEKLSGLQHITTLAYKLDTILAKQKKS